MQGPVCRDFTDQEMLYGYKIIPCCRATRHDWSRCFYVHPGERARRRCLRSHSYAAIMCPHVLHSGSGSCPNADGCHMAHNLFEYHMHPDKYRTKMCTSGADCKRNVCFYAHTTEELRDVRNSGGRSSPEHKEAALRDTVVSPGSSGAVVVSAADWHSTKAAMPPDAAALATGQPSESSATIALSSKPKGFGQQGSKSGVIFAVQASAAYAAPTELHSKQGASHSSSCCKDSGSFTDMTSASTSALKSSGDGIRSTAINCAQAERCSSAAALNSSPVDASRSAGVSPHKSSLADLNVSYSAWNSSNNSSGIPAELHSSLTRQFGSPSASSCGRAAAAASSTGSSATSAAHHDSAGRFSSPTASSCSSVQGSFCTHDIHSQAFKQATQQFTQPQSSLHNWTRPGSSAQLKADANTLGLTCSKLTRLSLGHVVQPSTATSDCFTGSNMPCLPLQHEGSRQLSVGAPTSNNSGNAPQGAGSSLFGHFSLFTSSGSSWGTPQAAAPLPESTALWSLTPFHQHEQQQEQELQRSQTQRSAAAGSHNARLPVGPAAMTAHAPRLSASDVDKAGSDPYYWHLCGHDWFLPEQLLPEN